MANKIRKEGKRLKMKLPQRITFFCNRRDPERDEFIEMLDKTQIPYSIIPTSGCSILWLRYENSSYSPMHYGQTALRFSLDALLKEVKNGKKYSLKI